VFTPFTLAGAMAPVTVAGALTLQNAEALAGIAFAQIVNPGAPMVYGGFTSNVDMKSGAPAFGTPEYMKAALVGGQLARRYHLPFRSSGVCAANTVDYQAALETTLSEWGAINGGANLIKHAAGWLEGGLSAGFEKFITDIDLLQMIAEYLTPARCLGGSACHRGDPRGGPGGPLLRHRAHPGPLQGRLLRARSSPTGAIMRPGRKPAARSPTTRPTRSTRRRWRPTSSRRSTRPSTRRSPPLSTERKAEGGAPTDF
jgi:trimethylamine--corrinoid protein Co-methyltransferase